MPRSVDKTLKLVARWVDTSYTARELLVRKAVAGALIAADVDIVVLRPDGTVRSKGSYSSSERESLGQGRRPFHAPVFSVVLQHGEPARCQELSRAFAALQWCPCRIGRRVIL
jgi:hypothetical protein